MDRLPGMEEYPLQDEALMNIRTVSSIYGAKAFEPSPKNGKKPDSVKSTTMSQEVVAFSDTSLTMQKLKDAVAAAPDIRIPIVEEIKEKIKNNNYPIDRNSDTILERMIKNRII